MYILHQIDQSLAYVEECLDAEHVAWVGFGKSRNHLAFWRVLAMASTKTFQFRRDGTNLTLSFSINDITGQRLGIAFKVSI